MKTTQNNYDLLRLKESGQYNKNSLNQFNIDMLKKDVGDIIGKYNKNQTKYPAIRKIRKTIEKFEKNDLYLSKKVLKSGYSNKGDKKFITELKPEKIAIINLILLPFLKNEYEKNNIAEEIFYSTISDIFLRIGNYHKNYGKIGLEPSEGNWLIRIFFMNIFKLGSLQFEKYRLRFSDFTDINKVKASILKEFDEVDVLSIHIMEGEDLSERSVKKSLDLAEDFFTEFYRYFYCRSWLLYEGLKNLLPISSNILEFAKNFDIIFQENDKTMAEERIFGDNFSPTSKNLTTLQKNALLNPQSLGVGVGVISIFSSSI